jgi:hypothetical protein
MLRCAVRGVERQYLLENGHFRQQTEQGAQYFFKIMAQNKFRFILFATYLGIDIPRYEKKCAITIFMCCNL